MLRITASDGLIYRVPGAAGIDVGDFHRIRRGRFFDAQYPEVRFVQKRRRFGPPAGGECRIGKFAEYHRAIWRTVHEFVYRRSFLGILWTVLNPLLNMFVMAFVFSRIFGRTGIGMDYPVYVLSGNIVFGFMRTATVTAMPSLVSNYDLITKTRTPYSVFPLSNVFTALVNFGFSLIALIVVMIVRIPAGVRFHWSGLMVFFPWLPAIFLFSAGLALLLSAVYVRFRDLKHIYNVLLTL